MFVIAVLAIGCGPAPTTATPLQSPKDPPRAHGAGARHVVVRGGTPVFDTQDATSPRGWLGADDRIGGWTLRVVDDDGARLRLSADLDASFEPCAAGVDGLRGLGLELYVPKTALATVITREVTLTADDCETIVARPGVVVTALCEAGGAKRYRVGSCPNADCVYEVPDDAIGTDYVASPHAAAGPSGDETAFPIACVDAIDAAGTRRPLLRDSTWGRPPATALARGGLAPAQGKLPACELEPTAVFCDERPRLGFDHVQYALRDGAKVTWRDGTPAGVAATSQRFRAVPRGTGDRLCWGAVEGGSSREDLVLCAPADAIQRVEEAHAVVLQARRDGQRIHWFERDDATACYREALSSSPALAGRVHASFRVEAKATTLARVDRPGDDAFARCLAARLDARDDARAPHTLELTIELHPAVTAGPARAPADGSPASDRRSPDAPRR
ncbi:MAG: hypothetical protein K1X88_07575 [Nannocystaceae bacterium]|nr:hypothetical protein [Nannocystaceae bacterium]